MLRVEKLTIVRKLLVILLMTCVAIVSGINLLFAQGWVDDGTVVRLETSTDKVGIGTTAPFTKLHISGQSLVLSGGDGGAMTAPTGGVLRMYYDEANDFATIWAYDYTGGIGKDLRFQPNGGNALFLGNGNVGIGTTAPVVKLHNNGDFITKGPWVDVRAYGAKGDGSTDDTAAIQAAIDSLKWTGQPSATGSRGGTVYFPPGRYRTTSTITITNSASLIVKGAGYGYGQNGSDYPDSLESASVIYHNSTVTGTAAFTVFGSNYGNSWGTFHIVFEDIGVKNLSSNINGFKIDNLSSPSPMHRVIFHRVSVNGGNIGIFIIGDNIFDVQVLGCDFEVNQNLAIPEMEYGIKSDSDSSPGISTVIRDCTFRNMLKNHVRFIQPAGNLTLENNTMESTLNGPSVYWVGPAGHLQLISNHWEVIFQNAYWNGTYLQVSPGDSTAASIVFVDLGASQVNVYGPDANTSLAGSIDPARTLPFIVQKGGKLSVYGGLIGPDSMATQGQPYFRFDGSPVDVTISGTTFKKDVSGNGALLGGSQTDIRGTIQVNGITNKKGFEILQGTNDDKILSLKSSDVAHGVTGIAETDTYGMFLKSAGAYGGLHITGLAKTIGTGVHIRGITDVDVTTRATSSDGYINLNAVKKSGTGGGAPGATANLAVIRGNDITRFIFANNGSAYADATWVNNAFDLAEEYDVNEVVDEGTVMTVDVTHDNRLAPTTTPYQIISGICSYHDAQLKNAFGNLMEKYPVLALHEYQNPTPIALVGLVPTKVTDEGGPIRRGDILVSSSLRGHAMKADPEIAITLNSRYVVGVALVNFDGKTGIINVQR